MDIIISLESLYTSPRGDLADCGGVEPMVILVGRDRGAVDGSPLMSSLQTLSVFVMTVTTPLGSVGQLRDVKFALFSSLHTSMPV